MNKHYSFEEKMNMREKYNQFGKLEDLLNEWDPVGLIEGGAPRNEYDCLTAKLLTSLLNNKSEKEIIDEILVEMKDHFSWPIEEEQAKGFFKRIFEIRSELFS